MERLKKILESLMRKRSLDQLKGQHYLDRIGGTIKRPAVLLFVLIYLVTCIPSPQNLTFAYDNETVSESGVSADSAEDGKEDSDGGSSSDDTSASEEDKKKEDADAADEDQKSEEAKSDDKSEEGKSEDATSEKDEGQKSGSTENKTVQKDSSGKTSDDKKHSSDKTGRPSASTEPTAGEKGELLYKKSTKDNSYTIRVTGDKESGIGKVASMNVTEVNKKDSIYIDSVKKLNKDLEKKKEGEIKDIRLYHIMFTDKDGKQVSLNDKVKVSIVYKDQSAMKIDPKDEGAAVRAFSVNTTTDKDAETVVKHIEEVNKEEEEKEKAKAKAADGTGSDDKESSDSKENKKASTKDEPRISVTKANWVDEKDVISRILRKKIVKEIDYPLTKGGVTGIAVTGTPEPEESSKADGNKGNGSSESSTNSDNKTDATEAGSDDKDASKKQENDDVISSNNNDTAKTDQADSDKDSDKDKEATGKKTVLTEYDGDCKVVVEYDDEAGIPDGAKLSIREIAKGSDEYNSYIKEAESAYTEDENADIKSARFYDIKILDANGNEVEPSGPVSVKITFDSMPVEDKNTVDLIHFEEKDKLKNKNRKRKEFNPKRVEDITVFDGKDNDSIDGVGFETDGFSVFGVIQTVKKQILEASDGRRYKVSVTYDTNSGIPEDAELQVTELSEEDPYYTEYVSRSNEILDQDEKNLSFAHAFDITLVDKKTGERYQPNKDVTVNIELLSENVAKNDKVSVVHFKGDLYTDSIKKVEPGAKNTEEISEKEKEAIKKAINSSETEVLESNVVDGAVEFATDGFSVYVLTSVNKDTGNVETITPQCTYTFWVFSEDANNYTEYHFTDDNDQDLTKQIIKTGDKLVVPQLTSTDTQVFAGWYEGTRGSGGHVELEDEPYDFENIVVTEDSAIDLYAVYKPCAKVIFHDQYDSEIDDYPVAITHRAEMVQTGEGDEAVTSATVNIKDFSTVYTSTGTADMAFLGWSETPVKTPGEYEDEEGNPYVIPSDTITITSDKPVVDLYPVFKVVHWLSFYAAESGSGADYVAPARYFSGEAVPTPLPKTAMDGYDFLGWWTGTLDTTDGKEKVNYGAQVTDENGDLVTIADDGGVYILNGKLYLRSDATLYARWEKKTEADYRIVIWKQNISDEDNLADSDKKYEDHMESIKLSAEIGQTVSVPQEYKEKTYTGYTYSHCDEDKVVNADGSTVLNVYYDKNSGYTPDQSATYTLKFEDSAAYIVPPVETSHNLPKTYPGITYGSSITDMIPENPSRRGYDFTKWYLDPYCTIEANLATMPDHDLTVYAGWETGWYVMTIDPNYGALYEEEDGPGTGATWFWSSYDGDVIGEYRHTTRNYVKSSSGTWYYVNHSGDGQGGSNGWPDRHTYYTQHLDKATEDTTFEYAPGIYTYVGWYEVNPDGSETPYTFGEHSDHNTTLRLHWKKAGKYYLAYDAGDGTLDDGSSKEHMLTESYSDTAKITLTMSANPPSKKTFVGWKVRGSDSNVVYEPGEVFTLNAEDATRVGGKDVVYLDAVYEKLNTAKIIYHANGGTLANEDVNAGQIPSGTSDWVPADGSVNTTEGTVTVSGLANKTKVRLSNGDGFIAPENSGAVFLGWSDKAVCDDSATFYDKESTDTYAVDTKEPFSLYAVWGVPVSYNLINDNTSWGDTRWDPSVYTLDEDEKVYNQSVARGNTISEPDNVPVYTGDNGLVFRYWATRTGSGSDDDPYIYTPYDFSQPVTGALDLYAYFGDPKTIDIHSVDAGVEDLSDAEANKDSEWLKDGLSSITVGTDEISFASVDAVKTYLKNETVPEGYVFDFAAVSSNFGSVSIDNKITAIKYDSKKKKVCVKYADDSDYSELEEGKGIYLVFHEERKLTIGYKGMESSGALSDVSTGGPTETDVALGSYSMPEQLNNPMSLVSPETYSYYSFAIGSADTHDDPQMNAANLSLLTDAVGAEDPVPTLRLRNTWRGFEYTTGTGDDAVWVSCGYDPHLYVIYYTQLPTVIVFQEETIGTNAVMDTGFKYDIQVDQTEVNGSDEITTRIYDTTTDDTPFTLKNGEQQSAILFYSSLPEGRVISQKITITQRANDSFNTTVASETGTITQPNKWEYTSDESGGTKTATFTNKHKALPVEVHVALAENDGTIGGMFKRDNLRSNQAENYKFDLSLGESVELLTKLPSDSVFAGDDDHTLTDYAYGAIFDGTAVNDGDPVTVDNMGVITIAYEKTNGNIYELVLKDGKGNILGELGSNELYYLYYLMPRIRYMKEDSDGSLTPVSGCLEDPITGIIEPAPLAISYSHEHIPMNGKMVDQNEGVEVPLDGLIISQSGNHFRMPAILDDGLFERYLEYRKIGAGDKDITNISALGDNISTDLTMYLMVNNNSLQYSFDGENWNPFPGSGHPTIYAIYDERGYDFQITKTVDTSASGKNAIFSESSYEVTISSNGITKNKYKAEGAESAEIQATPATEDTPGKITLTVQDSTNIKIEGLGHGDYTVTESGNENYTLTAKIGSIVGSTSTPIDVIDNSTVNLTLDSEKRLELTNSPKAICKIGDHYFYTLNSMVEYVDTEIVDKTAYVEMLTDYVMPAADAVEIPAGFNLRIATAEEGFSGAGDLAVITRTDALKDVPLFISNGNVTFENIELDGNSVEATAPMIQSAGDLTIALGATIKNVKNKSTGENALYGGAINATAGNITVGGEIYGCEAEKGGAIYHSGNGSITLNETGAIQNNTATTGDGGAIWLAGGMIMISRESKITGNKAESGNGGAIYANGVVEIEIDQGGAITTNTAKEGGAVYANATATIIISETDDSLKPAVTGNTATTGNGGAIYVNGGSVSVSGASMSGNKAENGQGGAVYSNSASVTVSGTAEVNNNMAKEGGAVYAVSGPVTISGGNIQNNTAILPEGVTEGTADGGAIYAGSGNVTVSGGSFSGNNATKGSGGAIYANSGNVEVTGGSLSQNTANVNGGAIYTNVGNITLSIANDNTATTVQGNNAANGSGGAIFSDSGTVSITGITLTGNQAGDNGGAVCANDGIVSVVNSIFGNDGEGNGNTAGNDGGAIYAGSGNVTVSGGSMKNNNSTRGSGGALYAGSGAAVLSTVTLSNNTAAAGKGGAVYLDSGSLTLTTVTATGNSAINGAAVFTNTGRANLSNGSYTGNIASNGGAVGVGSTDARLVLNGNVQIKDNKLGNADDAPKSNVYLDQDDDAVINIDTLGTNAAIGIYVADSVENTRGVPGARFAVYTSNNNVAKITNDRYTSLTVQSDTASKKLYWGNSITVEVMYKGSFANGLPNGTSSGRGTTVKAISAYYPTINSEGEVALSELAADVYTKNADVSNWFKNNNHPNATFGGAFYYDAPDYGYDITTLIWNTTAEKWQVRTRSGQTYDLPGRIYVIYSEPAYISIENNTEEKLTVSDLKMTVNGNDINVINSNEEDGYGMIFAKNGAIRTALLPITASDLTLAAGQSVSLLIPGGQNMAYTLDGSFETTTGGEVRLRRGPETSLSEETVTVSATDGTFEQLTGTTLNAATTYNIIFGNNKIICKVVDAEGREHPYSKISDAIADIIATTEANPPYTLETPKKATIEMVTDYLLTASDNVNIPKGYDIMLTTAAKEGATYCYNGTGDRATISRDTQNTDSMIKGWNSLENNKVVTTLRLSNLIFDGKSVRGSSDGGAVATQYVNVYVDTVDFKNVFATNGGALLVMFNFNKNNPKPNQATLADTFLEVRHSDFTGCTSDPIQKVDLRLGGGAIITNAEGMTLEDCDFTNCTAWHQAGAAFHRVDGNYTSWATVTNCTFTNCSAGAAGGLELNSKKNTVTGCTFEHCVATERNGGGFNVWALNSGETNVDCWTTLADCTFLDCQAYKQNGGGFRSASVYTTVYNCSFTNTSGALGGGIAMSNKNAKKGEIYGSTFNRCRASNQGGGVYCLAKEFIIGDGYYYPDNNKTVTVIPQEGGTFKDLAGNPIAAETTIKTQNTEIRSCTSTNEGGGVYQARDVSGSSLEITNASIIGNQTTAGSKNGGGVYTNARTVTIDGSTITDNTCTSQGGGVYANTYTSLSITDTNISHNNASGNGGGVWFCYNNQNNTLTIKGSTIDGNTSNNGSGGGIYTEAKTVTVGASEMRTDNEGKAIRSSVSHNTAKTNGGGIYHSRPIDGSILTISDTDIDSNTVSNGAGAGIYSNARTLTTTTSEISRNTSNGDGAGIWFDHSNNTDSRKKMSLTVEGCTLETNTSGGNGGSIFTYAKTVVIKDHTIGTGDTAVTTRTSISNSTAAKNGGGVYQYSKEIDNSGLTISDTDIKNNVANGTGNNELGGGGVYANVWVMTLTNSEVSGNKSAKHGGGICKNSENSGEDNRYLSIDNSTIKGNTAGNQGGGIYVFTDLKLKNNTVITGNRLTSNTAANCAGVYLPDGRTLFVGPENADVNTTDTIKVCDNTTANGTLSDLRLWWDSTNKENKEELSAYVYCHLSEDSEIRVVNADKVGTWFGLSEYAYPHGFSDDQAVFKADASTLHGIIDRNDESGKHIIWAGPPIAKITDGDGNILYLKTVNGKGSSPAIFDRLGTGDDNPSSVAAFNMLCTENPVLYKADGTLYGGPDDEINGEIKYCIKMLVSFETPADMNVLYFESEDGTPRDITFTTAGVDDADYPFTGTGNRATVTRGTGVSTNKPLISVTGNLKIENIIIDGGSNNGINATENTRCIYVNQQDITLTLGNKSIIQNGNCIKGGGGVNVNLGKLEINGSTIRNCTTSSLWGGGGVYMNGGNECNFKSGNIVDCHADKGYGGGIMMENATINMSGGTISDCTAKYGGGLGSRTTERAGIHNVFNMSGGSIINNSVSETGGGIAVNDKNSGSDSKLYFSKKVTVSGNKLTKDGKKISCNVELNKDSNGVINTNNGGLYPGSYIGVYVPGDESNGTLYYKHGIEKKPFGTFADGDSTTNLYCFVNDRNGLKGGIIANPDPNTIYWIKIFALEVQKNIVSGNSTTVDDNEQFLFKVNIHGSPSVSGQLRPEMIDSETGSYGEMEFKSNNIDTTSAVFALKNGEHITGVNLSEGLDYTIIEYLIVSGGPEQYQNQHKRYAAMPMNGYNSSTEKLTYDGTEYTVVVANSYTSKIGENKGRTDVDPYTSVVPFTNVMPVCKITDDTQNGNLLYQRYTWEKTTNNPNDPDYYYAPAVYTELVGDDGAFKALEGTLYSSNHNAASSYSVENGVKVQMLKAEYTQSEPVTLEDTVNNKKIGTVTLTTASTSDNLFPKYDSGNTSTIKRGFGDDSMFTVKGDLVLDTIILDGMKNDYTANVDGGIANVQSGGRLTIQNNATLQNSRTLERGGAVYVTNEGTINMTGGTVNKNESVKNGAGIYLAENSTMNLSGNPNFGGKGTNVAGNIVYTNGNWKNESLPHSSMNGGKLYEQPRQDIYIAETQNDAPASLVINGDLALEGDPLVRGSIWVWAESEKHYKQRKPFAVVDGITITADNSEQLKVFRDARPDDETDNKRDNDFLDGMPDGDTPDGSPEGTQFVYWYGDKGSAYVSLVKVLQSGATYQALNGRTFTVYNRTENGKGSIAKGEEWNEGSNDYVDKELKDLRSGKGGAFFIGKLPYGKYYVEENGINGKHFEFDVNEDGVVKITGTGNSATSEKLKTIDFKSN